MTVGELITVLQGLNQSSTVLTDTRYSEFLCELQQVYTGVAYKVSNQNAGAGQWVDDEPYRYPIEKANRAGYSSVYLGLGDGIVSPKWTRIAP